MPEVKLYESTDGLESTKFREKAKRMKSNKAVKKIWLNVQHSC